ncbi:MAG TPA: AMP-binding protein [Solirubrobacteraceae bacterium]|nr:AMP-binding protein [Solirubrobacteraceae bacterium]
MNRGPVLFDLIRPGPSAALVCPDDGLTYTHEDVGSLVTELAGRLSTAGVERGDRVAVVLPNGPEIVLCLFAIGLLGAVTGPLNPDYTETEYRFYLSDLAPRFVIAGSEPPAALTSAVDDIPLIEATAARSDARPTFRLNGSELRSAGSFDHGGPEDAALLLHTSGTTSRPKQVPLLQRNLTAQATSIASHYALSESDVSFVAMPLFHVHGLVASTLAQIAAGGRVVTPRRLVPGRFWDQAREHGMTWYSASPTPHQKLLGRLDEPPPTLRFVRSCSSALSAEMMRAAEARLGVPMVEAYGMTENTHQMTSNPLPPAERRPGSVGVPAGAAVRIVDDSGSDVPAGEPGEVAISGPGLTPGYLANEKANAESFFDGWFRTGDIGVLDGGYLVLKGRRKEMINRGGENISPAEVEAVLVSHPSVSEAVAFSVPDTKYGERVAAAVVLTGEVSTDELRRHARESLAAFKVPDEIYPMEEIPKTPTGKVQRSRMAGHLQIADR